MEIEYKWNLQKAHDARVTLEVAEAISPYVRGAHDISMHAIYYDTSDGAVFQHQGGLRLRSENDVSVCCLKFTQDDGSGCAVRQEYEVEAPDIHSGLMALPGVGAPQEFCDELLASGLVVLCETQFERRAFTLAVDGDEGTFAAELAFDEGVLRREGREQELREMELEHKDGSLPAFHAFAQGIEGKLGLERQPLSKLARAMQV